MRIPFSSSYYSHTDTSLSSPQHSYIANGLGGKNGSIVVDLRNFQKITVDDNAGTAVIEMGNRLGDIVTALAAHGRGLPHGTCPYVGIGGHAGTSLGFRCHSYSLPGEGFISVFGVSYVSLVFLQYSEVLDLLRGSGAWQSMRFSLSTSSLPMARSQQRRNDWTQIYFLYVVRSPFPVPIHVKWILIMSAWNLP